MEDRNNDLIQLDLETLWNQVYTVNPLVIVGTLEGENQPNFAPKHMAFPLGWDNYFGFVCTPNHSTYQNIKEREQFTVTYPKPDQVINTSLTATQRRGDDTKLELESIPRFPATDINGYFLKNGYLYLECRLNSLVDGFGTNSLILGEIVSAHVDRAYIRRPSKDDNELIYNHPLIAYLNPGRFAIIDKTQAFPFPSRFKK